jgi:hypothetical protein
MKTFLLKVFLFAFVIIGVSVALMLFPPTPRESSSLLFSQIHKDSLLENAASPRIIFIGGSNLSFGLNSRMIQESLGMHPINTGIHANIGLFYMMDHVLPYIISGDVVVVSPEYSQYFGKEAYGGEELLRIVLDVTPSDIYLLKPKQWANIIGYFPKFLLSKIDPDEYSGFETSDIYGIQSFNAYGDVDAHWELERGNFSPYPEMKESLNESVLDELDDFRKELQNKGASLWITFPGFQSASFENNRKQILRVEAELRAKNFPLLGSSERYIMPESLMFNTPYHLVKEGVDYRTRLLIEDIRKSQVHGSGPQYRSVPSNVRGYDDQAAIKQLKK